MEGWEFAGKLCVITGSGGGLGKEFAGRLLAKGCKVVISDVNAALGEATADELADIFGEDKVTFVQCDVTKADHWERLFKEAELTFGGQKVSLLVNNAGVMGEREGWQTCLDINLQGVLLGCNEMFGRATDPASENMGLRQPQFTVVNIASILGLFTGHEPKGWAYNTSKCGVVVASRAMANVNKSVRVMCLCPSVTRTPILDGCSPGELETMKKDVGGFMEAKQVGDAFLRLLSEGKPGTVISVWRNTPPYQIPDTSMPTFVFWTICAMAFKFWPQSYTPTIVRPGHMLTASICILLLHFAAFYLAIYRIFF